MAVVDQRHPVRARQRGRRAKGVEVVRVHDVEPTPVAVAVRGTGPAAEDNGPVLRQQEPADGPPQEGQATPTGRRPSPGPGHGRPASAAPRRARGRHAHAGWRHELRGHAHPDDVDGVARRGQRTRLAQHSGVTSHGGADEHEDAHGRLSVGPARPGSVAAPVERAVASGKRPSPRCCSAGRESGGRGGRSGCRGERPCRRARDVRHPQDGRCRDHGQEPRGEGCRRWQGAG
jgi:hypothetical protein